MVAQPAPGNAPIPIHQPSHHRHNLPLQPTPLIGRADEVAALRSRLLDPDVRLLTLTGPPGTGKTRLALAVAESVIDEFPDGVWFVPLESVHEPEAVIPALARVLGVREVAAQSLQTTMQEHLAGRQVLLLLDNLEHVLDAGVDVAALLAACPAVTVLVTSRMPLRLRWEREMPVSPLALPEPARSDDAATIAESAAVQLFVERATAVRPGFRLTTDNAGAVAEICRRLDGLPLAIELAAARIKILSPAAIRDRLGDRLALLTGGARDLPERHQTLRAALTWSYDLLSGTTRALFRMLGVFTGGCTLAAVEAVCEETASLDLLHALADHSLLRWDEQRGGEPRLRMLETIRGFALEQLAAGGELDGTHRRHATYFLALAEAAEPELQGTEQADWLARLAAEHDNLRAALNWSLSHDDDETALRIAGALGTFWNAHGHLSEGRRWLDRALDRRQATTTSRAKALAAAGTLAHSQGDFATARALHEECLALRRELDDVAGIAAALNSLGNIDDSQGDFAAARICFEESLALRRREGHALGIASALNNLGNVAAKQGDYAEAQVRYEESLALLQTTGDVRRVALATGNLGIIAMYRGDAGGARVRFEECLALQRSAGDSRGIASALHNLGWASIQQEDYVTAQARLEECLALRRELGDMAGIALALHNLGDIARKQGRLAAAHPLYAEGLVLRHQIGDRLGIAYTLHGLAELADAQGQSLRAARLLGAEGSLRESIDAPIPASALTGHERLVAALRTALGETAFASAWAAGRVLPLEEAIAEALTGSGERPEPIQDSSFRVPRSSLPDGLTPREGEVLSLIAAGHTNREIAETLVISLGTVERHIANLYGKIHARGRAGATAYALRHNLHPTAP